MEAVTASEEAINFPDILLQTEKLMSDVAGNFFKDEAPSKPSADDFAEAFKAYIFNGKGMNGGEINKTYHTVVSTLR